MEINIKSKKVFGFFVEKTVFSTVFFPLSFPLSFSTVFSLQDSLLEGRNQIFGVSYIKVTFKLSFTLIICWLDYKWKTSGRQFRFMYDKPRASQVALVVKNPPASAGDNRDASSIPGSGRSPGGGHGNPLQCSFLENPMDGGAWQDSGSTGSQSWT